MAPSNTSQLRRKDNIYNEGSYTNCQCVQFIREPFICLSNLEMVQSTEAYQQTRHAEI